MLQGSLHANARCLRELLANPGDIDAALAEGALRAEEIAAPIIDRVNDIVGFLGAGAKSG